MENSVIGKINILGVPYSIMVQNDLSNSHNCDAYCNHTSKTIMLDKFGYDDISEKWKVDEKYYMMVTLRHEIVHAVLYESGLRQNSMEVDAWADNEEMVDWIAIQYDKLKACFESGEELIEKYFGDTQCGS